MADIDEDEESALLLRDSGATENAIARGRQTCRDSLHTLEEGISRRKAPRASDDNGEAEYRRLNCNPKDELRSFKIALLFFGLHQLSLASFVASWILFFIFSILVPVLGIVSVACISCSANRVRDLNIVVQVSESSLAVISFLFLSHALRKHGLPKLLLLDEIERECRTIELAFKEELSVCSVVQLTGFLLCLHGAARITHRAQGIISIVSEWHVLSTCQSFTMSESESENLTNEPHSLDADGICFSSNKHISDVESVADVCAIVPSQYEFASFLKRQALVSYMQHSNAGISLYGFVLDRGFICAIFGLELSLVLFILGLTIAIN